MRQTIILTTILILGFAYAVEDKGSAVGQGFSLVAEMTIPKSINFQGYLYRDGNPMDTTMNMWFGIYDDPSAGNQLFQQTINNVTVTKGWFLVSLDNIPNSVFPVGGPTRYLEVKAPSTGQALTPRLSLASVGYSFHALSADSAGIANDIKDGAVTMPKINQSGATAGQVIKWNGTAWTPNNDIVGGDSDWVRGTPDSVLYTIRPLGIARGGVNNMLYGNQRQTHTNLGVACTTGASGQNYSYSVVGGGYGNIAGQSYATVGGGDHNKASGGVSTIAGGRLNVASRLRSTVGGGTDNMASAEWTTVSGGYGDTANAVYATVCGGTHNTARGEKATVSGGSNNNASDIGATVGGGYDDTASARAATVSGGARNHATGIASTVGGGADNTASGDNAAVPGGNGNVAQGRFSFAAGRKADALHSGSFVWADSTNATFSSTSPNQFLIRATNGVGIGTNDPQAMLDVAGKFKNQNAMAEVWDTIPTSTSSQNYVDLSGMSITVNTTNSRLFIDFVGSCSVSSGLMWFRLLLDEVTIGFTLITAGAGNTTASILRMPIVSAGSHTVKVQWMVSGSNTGYCPEAIDGIKSAGTRTLTVIEY